MSDADDSPGFQDLDAVGGPRMRELAHRMLDDMIDYTLSIRERPVWAKMQPADRDALHTESPQVPMDPARVYEQFQKRILPFTVGNVHPGFMGWVHGGGTLIGMLAEMLAAGLNANCGGRDHAPIEIERQIVEWSRQWFGLPPGTSGLFVTGGSMANFVSVLVARRSTLGAGMRREGLVQQPRRLMAYTSAAAHACIARAMDYAGLGAANLRLIPFDAEQRVDVRALREAIGADRTAGHLPFLVVGNAGTVDIGATDDLAALADVADAQDLWFHVDGALGGLGVLAPQIAPRMAGIERADSLALDFHKWLQVPYDAGFVLIRDGTLHRETFATAAAYLQRASRGI